MIQTGSWAIHAVEGERFRLDGGAMFGVVPRVLWSRSHPPDERNRIRMVTRCLVARGEGRTVLVDTGMGSGWTDKEREIYAIENGPRSLTTALSGSGISPADVTDVILTHLHFDHAGGAVSREDGKLTAAFPNARYHVQAEHLDWALKPTEKDRRSFREDDFIPLQKEGRLRLLDGTCEVLPGIAVTSTRGHTIGHQVVRIGEGRGSVVYCGDLIPTAAHVPVPWVMAYDLQPLLTMQEKRELLARAASDEEILVFEHDPGCAAARVAATGDGFSVIGEEDLSPPGR